MTVNNFWEILVGEKLVNCEPFAKIFLAYIHRYTENIYGVCTDCSLFTKFFLANSFYLHAYIWFTKILPHQIFPVYGIKVPMLFKCDVCILLMKHVMNKH